ncbi:MAG: rod shape-determining protein MreC [Bacteroidota bacterium]
MTLAGRLWERSRDYVLVAVLLLASVLILLRQNGPALRSARAAALDLTARVEGVFSWAGRYTAALQENERLRQSTIELAAEAALLREARAENRRLRALLALRDSSAYRMMPARVVGKDLTRQSNQLTLNVGAEDGIVLDMPVVDDRGIVGKVSLVSDHYSLVLPHQNTNFAVPARIDELGRDGLVRWDGTTFDRLTMDYVVRTEPVAVGQRVVTSGFSDVFPPGIPVGRIDSVLVAGGRNDFVLYVEPAAPISTVDYVYVILRAPDPERAALETQGS